MLIRSDIERNNIKMILAFFFKQFYIQYICLEVYVCVIKQWLRKKQNMFIIKLYVHNKKNTI